MVVAHTVRTNTTMHGARPFDPARDLASVARLLEEAFRSEHTFPLSNTPFLREVGIFLWTMSYAPVFPENVTGFVWVEDGRIVGNVTISQDEGRLDRFLISNVAVKPDYRRKGIARELMQMAIQHVRARGARWTLLNVRPNNGGAIKLYRDLGFQEVEMRGDWMAKPSNRGERSARSNRLMSHTQDLSGLVIHPLRTADRQAATELVRAATPSFVQQFRLPHMNDHVPNWEDRLTEAVVDFFVGQVTRRWVVFDGSRMTALLLVRGQRLASPHRIAVQVHPDFRGRVENLLAGVALEFLARFPERELHAVGTSTHPEWTVALEQQGFSFLNGLTLMALPS